RTADVVGLDVMQQVARNLYEAVPDDESRDRFRLPEVVERLVAQGALGQKSGAGFYRKEGKEIRSIDPETGTYAPPRPLDLGDLAAVERIADLPSRLRAIYADDGRAGAFFRSTILDVLAYSARRLPEIADSPADVDRALRWGFGWEMGPFETWDALGFDTVRHDARAHGFAL